MSDDGMSAESIMGRYFCRALAMRIYPSIKTSKLVSFSNLLACNNNLATLETTLTCVTQNPRTDPQPDTHMHAANNRAPIHQCR